MLPVPVGGHGDKCQLEVTHMSTMHSQIWREARHWENTQIRCMGEPWESSKAGGITLIFNNKSMLHRQATSP